MSSIDAQPSVCVVICNFNKADDLVVAVESVLASTGVTVEVIVVDNCSTDDSVEAVRSLGYSQVEVVVLEENIGGSGGFKAGMDIAAKRSAEFVLLLDNDACVAKDTLSGLVEALRVDSELGAVGPAILKAYKPSEVQDIGGFLSTKYFAHLPGFNGLPYAAMPKTPLYCEYLASCCLLTRRSILQQVGSFDPGYFIYWDDVDWCTRLREAGYRLKVIPELRAWHKGGIQAATSTTPTYFNVRNRVEFFRRHPSRWSFTAVKEGIQLNLREISFGCLLKNDLGYISTNLRGFSDGLNGVFGSQAPVDLPQRNLGTLPSLPISRGGTYELHLDDWFFSDSFEFKRLNPALTHGDYYRLSRLVAAIYGLKNLYSIRVILNPFLWVRFDGVEKLVLSDLVEVRSTRGKIPMITIYRHLLDSAHQSSDATVTTDSFLNVCPTGQTIGLVADRSLRLLDGISKLPWSLSENGKLN